jgi:formylglycine-generating enzyme required for sulfatase activity
VDVVDVDSASVNGTFSGERCAGSASASTGCVEPATPVTVCCASGPGCPGRAGPAMARIAPSDGGMPFCIDTTEVTAADYLAFLAAGGPVGTRTECAGNDTALEGGTPAATPQPITEVDWCDAVAYCEWAGKRLCGLRTGAPGTGEEDEESDPALSEWRLACTEGERTTAQYGTSCSFGAASRRDVRADPCCQRDGVHQLPGNVAEWVDSCDATGRCLYHTNDSCNQIGGTARTNRQTILGFRCCADAL